MSAETTKTKRIKITPFSKATRALAEVGHKLHDYQRDGVKWLISREDRDNKITGGLLCDEMGLGKTIQFISLLLSRGVGRTLLVLPASLMIQWREELGKFAPEIPIFNYHGEHRSLKHMPDRCVVMTTYTLVHNDRKTLGETIWTRVILDECHNIRNPKAKSSKACKSLRADSKWGITGTPIQNYVSDIVSALEFVGITREEIRSDLPAAINKYTLRRTKSEVSLDDSIPDKSIKRVILPHASKKEADFYKQLENSELFNPLEKTLRLRQASIAPKMVLDGIGKKTTTPAKRWTHTNTKLDSVFNKCQRRMESDDSSRIIIFTTFKYEIEYLTGKFAETGFKYSSLHGGVPKDERNSRIADAENQVLMVQIVCGGTGLNLQSYNVIYFTSPPWNPSLEDQAIARCHRIGQDKPVDIYKMYIKKSIEEHINAVQEVKRTLIAKYITS
jgi:SNF2 family DNA or RNA helicase